MPENQKIAEVIEASTTQFVSQCYELYCLPSLGSLVKTGDIYGIVCGAETSSIEQGRRPIARGKDEPSEEEVYRSSPQLAKLLRSEFSALAVGYKGDKIYQHLPAEPARIHSFVYMCTDEEVKEFSRSFGFLNILVKAALPVSAEELVSACLRQMAQVYGKESHKFMVAAGKQLASILSGDFAQLKAVLERLNV